MKKNVMFCVVLCIAVCSLGLSFAYEENQIVYFDYPISVASYNPYNFSNGRSFGVPSTNGRHTGEDIELLESNSFNVVSAGTLRRYKQDGSYPYGYGEFYAVTTHQLSRQVRVVLGDGVVSESDSYMFIYGHIRNKENRDDEFSLSWPTGITLNKDVSYKDLLGYINDDAHNGDGAEHLHLGARPDHDVNSPYGYEKDIAPLSGYCPAHLIISASRIGVYNADNTHSDPYWNSEKSEAFINKWWEEYGIFEDRGGDTDQYRYMELGNYHNKLGRPNNNRPNAPGEGTDFVHKWTSSFDSAYRIYIQDMYQPYENQSRFDSGHTALILNEYLDENKTYLLKEGFSSVYNVSVID